VAIRASRDLFNTVNVAAAAVVVVVLHVNAVAEAHVLASRATALRVGVDAAAIQTKFAVTTRVAAPAAIFTVSPQVSAAK
jgi:hypothetical protein